MSLQPLEFIQVKEEEEEQNPEEEDDDKHDENVVDEEENGQEDEILSCKYCQFQTEDIDELDEHILSHDEALGEEDGTEDTEVVTRELEEEHVISQDTPKVSQANANDKHEKSPNIYTFVCPYPECNHQSISRRVATVHFTDHCKFLDIPVFYGCSECCYRTRRKNDMPKHLLTHCESIGALLFNCPDCSYASKRKSDLNKHLICHSKSMDTLLTCHVCGYTSRRMQDLKKHLIIHDSREDYVPKFNCTECGYSSKRLTDLHKHVVLHSDRNMKGIFKCLNCPYMTTETLSFAKHVLNLCNFVENGATILADSADQHYVVLEEDNVTLYNNTHKDNVFYVEELDTAVDQILPSRQSTRVKFRPKRAREEESEPEEATNKVLVLAGFNEGRGNVII